MSVRQTETEAPPTGPPTAASGEFRELLADLAQPQAYPHAVDEVEVIQTHISAVFLAGPRVYKVRKPLNLGFLDFTTLERRERDCHEEVRLNRRLSPDVYEGVVPIVRRAGRLHVGGAGEVEDFAVKMKRLPADRTLLAMLERGELGPEILENLAARIARFHADAEAGERAARWATWEVVAANCRENFEQVEPFIGRTICRDIYDRLRRLTDVELGIHQLLIEQRARRGVARDTHGDLHLEHVYHFPDRPPPGDLVVIDCIEFNDRFRYADPVADVAFLAMDLEFHGRPDLAAAFNDAYFKATGDTEGRALLPLYTAYRAVVRGKVESFELTEAEIPRRERQSARRRARAHFLLALGKLAMPEDRPCLVLIGGLPGAGKSRLADALSRTPGFHRLSTDQIRKELAGVPEGRDAQAPFGRGIYTPAWTERTYSVCLERARDGLLQGRRLVIDATFRDEARRRAFLDAARAFCVPGLFLQCEASMARLKARLEQRRGGLSDADWDICRRLAERWEPAGPQTVGVIHRIDTSGDPASSVDQALGVLRGLGLI